MSPTWRNRVWCFIIDKITRWLQLDKAPQHKNINSHALKFIAQEWAKCECFGITLHAPHFVVYRDNKPLICIFQQLNLMPKVTVLLLTWQILTYPFSIDQAGTMQMQMLSDTCAIELWLTSGEVYEGP